MIRITGRCLRAAVMIGLTVVATACDRRAKTAELSEAELAAFSAPADSSLAPAQIDRYLRTVITQLEIVQAEAPAVRERLRAGRTSPAADSITPMARWSRFMRESYLIAARRNGYDPAEMEYVRARLTAASGYLSAATSQGSGREMAAMLRQQADALRGNPQASQAQVEMYLRAAEQAEAQVASPPPARIKQNLDAMHRARPNVTDAMWSEIGRLGGMGLMAAANVSDQAQFAARLREIRPLFDNAVQNRAYTRGSSGAE
jgi:hypothetical protein